MVLRQLLRRCAPDFVKIAIRAARGYRRHFGRNPRLFVGPPTFSEWIQRRKVFDRDPRLPLRADKVLVKRFVAATIGAEHVIPTLWHGRELPPREQRDWPRPFVVKANHASGWNLFVRDEHEHDWARIEHKARQWMAGVYGHHDGEWLYGQIEPQILVEPFINGGVALPVDYKLWVFGGKVRFVQVDLDREHEHKRVLFDTAWNRLDCEIGYPSDPRPVEPPASLARMIEFAEALVEDIDFVRVDFYELDGRPLFGEMTFYPGGGYEAIVPAAFDRQLGALLA